ncbi:MAG: endopeptidase [Thermoleophilia bacterium]|nr:endopeptidase [Thermoleophilia bacterium]
MSSVAPTTHARTLAPGSSGVDVARLKARLRALHYAVDPGRTFTDATRNAVMAFQKVNGLERDGVAGVRTLAAMRHAKGVSVGHGEASRVVVDLSDQVLLVVRGGRVQQIVNACTGNPDLPDGRGEATPVGTFRVGRRVRGPDRAELGVLYSPSYFTGGIAVHGAPSVLATPASHGCVRIPMHLAQPIQDAMRAGSQVQVRP